MNTAKAAVNQKTAKRGMANRMNQPEKPLPEDSQKETGKKTLTSQTLVRGLDVIEAISAGINDISDIAKKTGMTYSTTHRIVSVLQQRHYIKREPEHGYTLGRKLLELGFRAYSQVNLTRIAHPILKRLAQETSDTVHLAYAELDSVVYLDKVSGRRPLEISSRIGGSKPLISTGVGKALLLDDSEDVWNTLYDHSAHLLRTAISKAQWLETMRRYAKLGYSYDLGEDELSIRCVAAPVRDGSKKIIAAISLSSTLEYMSPQRMESLAPVVQLAAKQISAELGG